MRKGKGSRGHLSKLVRKRKCMVGLKESNAEKERTGEEKNGKKGKERKGKREENVAQGFFGSRRFVVFAWLLFLRARLWHIWR